jgi:hypothetical protein
MAGVASATVIDTTPGIVYHLDAALGVTQSGGAVSGWADQSGQGRNFAQATAVKQPTLIGGATAGNIGGLPVIRFDGDTSGSVSGSSPNADELILATSTTVQTFVIVNRSTTSVGLDGIWGDEAADVGVRREGSPNGAAGWQHPGNSNTFSNGGSMFVNGLAATTIGSAPDGTPHILIATRGASTAFPDTSIGDYFASGTVSPRSWSGEVAELAVYDRALTTAEQQSVEQFLGQKYGIAVVPEPTAVGGTLVGLGALALARRRRRPCR